MEWLKMNWNLLVVVILGLPILLVYSSTLLNKLYRAKKERQLNLWEQIADFEEGLEKASKQNLKDATQTLSELGFSIGYKVYSLPEFLWQVNPHTIAKALVTYAKACDKIVGDGTLNPETYAAIAKELSKLAKKKPRLAMMIISLMCRAGMLPWGGYHLACSL